jgi:hypothetical protein
MAAILSGRSCVARVAGQPVCQTGRYVLESHRDSILLAGFLPNILEEHQ